MLITISGYQIHQRVYGSNTSVVYRGSRERDDRPVFLKMLAGDYVSPERVAWFKREYEIITTLKLPGVIEAYSLETDQHGLFMVLEDFGGISLRQCLSEGPLSLEVFLPLAVEIVEILSQVHHRHIMHKDLNPSNLVWNRETGQVKLIDFGIATVLSRENPTLRSPDVLEGTLAYISPEQTGRMNRTLDYRTDFYSLGVTFYELLTGQRPFPATDAMELVHAHIAKHPVPPHEQTPGIPRALSEIVLKLMAKNAEDRYQSAQGIKADLEQGLQHWRATGAMPRYALGRHDVSDRFQIPQQLYGRDREIETLLATFERVSEGAGEMLLLSGYAGIGKTALVQEVHKPITRRRGYFIAGKFDQLQRNVPYASLAKAFQGLIRQLLTESEERIAAWREHLLAALGPNGQVIIDVIADVELLIGPQPALPALAPTEAQHRFKRTFHHFIRVFACPEHPLVLFLDDLQWADTASLDLVQFLMTAPDRPCLLLLGAYRDNEVSEAHRLMSMIKEIRNAGVVVHHIVLAPLGLPHVNQLIAETLKAALTRTHPLADLVRAKTNGNPFFMKEFLKSLYTEELLAFDLQQRRWQWDLEAIQARDMTDNVVELMAHKVQRLPALTQQVLKRAACIGSVFDLQTLAIVYDKPARETATDLWEAIAEGLVLPLGDAYTLMTLDVEGLTDEVVVEYKFAHDRIQQAVYSLIPESDKKAVHQQVGRLLLRNTPPEERDQRLFDIVNHLNLGVERFEDRQARYQQIELNLAAGRKAKASAAYQTAYQYLQVGVDLLETDSWERHYDLALRLTLEALEAAYLSGHHQQMEQLAEVVERKAQNFLDKAKVFEIRIRAYNALAKPLEAVHAGLEILKLLGVEFPETPGQAHFERGLKRIEDAMQGKRIEDLVDLPEMTDPATLTSLRILSVIYPAAFVGFPEIFPLCVLRMVELSIIHGNAVASIDAYVAYGLLLCGPAGDSDTGYRFGKLAMDLLERFEAQELRAKVIVVFNIFIKPWKQPVREAAKAALEAYHIGLETGDLHFGTQAAFLYTFASFWCGVALPGLEREMAQYGEVLRQLKQEQNLHLIRLYRQAVLNLMGPIEDPCRLVGEAYDEETTLPLLFETPDPNELRNIYLLKLVLCYLFGDFRQAVEYAAEAEKLMGVLTGTMAIPIFTFYDSLARLAVFDDASSSEKEQILQRVAAHQQRMKHWAQHAPMNYLHRFCLVEAERARVLEHEVEARDYYDKAVTLAREHAYTQDEALANERAAHFYLERGLTNLARHYSRDAHHAYLRWGAQAKVDDLEARYPQLLASATPVSDDTTTTRSGMHTSQALDLTSLLKASQAISGEIVLDKLLATLMKIAIENAGAQQGSLILERAGRWVIEAEGAIDEQAVTVLQALPIETVAPDRFPAAIVNYVIRTRESVVLSDAGRQGPFTRDPYVVARQAKSVLCAPLIYQGELNGVLYLENRLTPGVFTRDRLEVLNLLSSQAAISIKNATLYAHQIELTRASGRFLPHEFLHFLGKQSITEVRLGDHVQQEMAILFSDIRSFMTLSETMTPQENFDFVNEYLGRVSPVIRQHNGIIVKYLGDGFMAVFPGPIEEAFEASIEMMDQVALLNDERRARGEIPIKVGTGVHSGKTMLGTVGEAERMQADLLSDTVNLANRLEGLTKIYGSAIIISEAALDRVTDPARYSVRFLGKAQVKGRQEAVSIFEVLDGEPADIREVKLATRAAFEEGLTLYYEKQFAEAGVLFSTVLQRNPDDKTARLYLQRTEKYRVEGVPPQWEGIVRMTEK